MPKALSYKRQGEVVAITQVIQAREMNSTFITQLFRQTPPRAVVLVFPAQSITGDLVKRQILIQLSLRWGGDPAFPASFHLRLIPVCGPHSRQHILEHWLTNRICPDSPFANVGWRVSKCRH